MLILLMEEMSILLWNMVGKSVFANT